jgi:hypothetical protein
VTTLTVVLTHLEASRTEELLALQQAVAPTARFAVAHAGPRSEFERLAFEDKFFVEDAALRGPVQHLQSLNEVFATAWREFFAADPDLDALYLIEYDHLVLDATFEERLRALAAATGADLLGKTCVDATGTNLAHYVRFRRDERLLRHLAAVSVRDDPARLFSCLGDGIWVSRRALEAYVAVGEHPPCYCEIYVPTLVHHLGFRVVDVGTHSDLYDHVRWQPEHSAGEVLALARDGAVFVHPAKQQEVLAPLRNLLLTHSPASPAT